MSAEEAGLVPRSHDRQRRTRSRRCRCSRRSPARERDLLLSIAKPVQFAAGESIVRQGDAGRSLFIVRRRRSVGDARRHDGEVARLRQRRCVRRDVAADRRTAHRDRARRRSTAIWLKSTQTGFRAVVMANPSVLEHVTTVAAARREELDRHRETHTAATSPTEIRRSLLERVRDFLRL